MQKSDKPYLPQQKNTKNTLSQKVSADSLPLTANLVHSTNQRSSSKRGQASSAKISHDSDAGSHSQQGKAVHSQQKRSKSSNPKAPTSSSSPSHVPMPTTTVSSSVLLDTELKPTPVTPTRLGVFSGLALPSGPDTGIHESPGPPYAHSQSSTDVRGPVISSPSVRELERTDHPTSLQINSALDRQQTFLPTSSNNGALDFSNKWTGVKSQNQQLSATKTSYLENKGTSSINDSTSTTLMMMPSSLDGKVASMLSSSLPVSEQMMSSHLLASHISNIGTRGAPDLMTKPLHSSPPSLPSSLPSSSTDPLGSTPNAHQQAFTEGKLKKKWTQRMMVEAKKEEDDKVKTLKTTPKDPHAAAPVKLETGEPHKLTHSFDKDIQAGRHMFHHSHDASSLLAKSANAVLNMKTEAPHSAIESNHMRMTDYPTQTFQGGHFSSRQIDRTIKEHGVFGDRYTIDSKPDIKYEPPAMHSNTLYRALMGQPPSHLNIPLYDSQQAMTNTSTISSSLKVTHRVGDNKANQSSKVVDIKKEPEEGSKVFIPVACGKKMMEHIVERLSQTEFSGEQKPSFDSIYNQNARYDYRTNNFTEDSSNFNQVVRRDFLSERHHAEDSSCLSVASTLVSVSPVIVHPSTGMNSCRLDLSSGGNALKVYTFSGLCIFILILV